jgi:hypothetical protein
VSTFCFKCPTCGYSVEGPVRDPAPVCWNGHDTVDMVRDWRAEGASPGNLTVLRKDREAGVGAARRQAELFLPTADDYRSPSDPTGQKGLREWADTHEPQSKRPQYPADLEKHVY